MRARAHPEDGGVKVAHLDTGRTWRGGQAQVLLLLEGLRARRVESMLLAPPGPLLDRARALGIETRRWSSHGELDVPAALAAARELKGVDLAHCHSAHAHALGVPAARLARVPGVVVSRRVDFAVAQNGFSRLKYRLPVDRYLCISRGVLEVMERGGVAPGRLARVAGERPDVRFVWLGDGECRGALERQRRELGLERVVHLLGFREDALSLMQQFTLFALSSYLEGLCTSLLDAQRLGVPVVATAVGGIPDVIESGVNGLLVPPRDPAALATGLIEALDHSERGAAWAAAGRIRVERFRAEHMVESTLQVYRDVLAERGLAHATR